MSSRGIVDLRKRKPGLPAQIRARMRRLSFGEPQPPDRGGRHPPLRVRRRRFHAVVAALVVLALGGAVYGVSYASHLPQFSIQSVAIEGVKEIRAELVRAYAETVLFDGSLSFLSRTNIFMYPQREIERAIAEYFPRVRVAHISRASLFAQAITIAIEERAAFARWCTTSPSTGSCFLLDEDGFIFASGSTSVAVLKTQIVFGGGLSATSSPIGQVYLPGNFRSIRALLERLGQAGFSPEKMTVEGERDFSIGVSRGFVIRASFGAQVDDVVHNLELVLFSETLRGKEDKLEYIDLRFGNRVYYRLKGSSAEERIQNE